MNGTITVSTDGSALGNPNGPMGWAWADHAHNTGHQPGHDHDDRGYDAGGATNGTNQIGELCAVLEALRAHPGPRPLLIETDSQYAINCSTTWIRGWKKNGWKNSQKKPVKNVELIKAIDAEISRREGPVHFKWVKGHAGNAGNELVDELARTYAGDCRSGARDGYLPIEGWRSLLASEYAQGLDVPPDVQLVLDGKADADSLQRPDSKQSGHSSPAARPALSLADRLAEPEGVPDYGDFSSAAGSDADNNGNAGNTSDDNNRADIANDEGHTSASDTTTVADESSTSTSAPVPSAGTSSATGLVASGSIRITPAPSTSPRWAGKDLHITGTILLNGGTVTIDAPISQDGTIELDGATFHLRDVRER